MNWSPEPAHAVLITPSPRNRLSRFSLTVSVSLSVSCCRVHLTEVGLENVTRQGHHHHRHQHGVSLPLELHGQLEDETGLCDNLHV